MSVTGWVEPIATDPGVSVGDDDAHRAIALQSRTILSCVPLALLVHVEVFLPDVAQLEDPVVAFRRTNLHDERFRDPLLPPAKPVMSVRYTAIARVQRPAEADPVGPLGEILLPPGAHELGITQNHLTGLGERLAHLCGLQ